MALEFSILRLSTCFVGCCFVFDILSGLTAFLYLSNWFRFCWALCFDKKNFKFISLLALKFMLCMKPRLRNPLGVLNCFVRLHCQGRDDMRMDERLMQFLRATNEVLSTAKPAGRSRRLAVTPFAITPLGPRLGLVQWVPNTVPLFQVSSCSRLQTLYPRPWSTTGSGAVDARHRPSLPNVFLPKASNPYTIDPGLSLTHWVWCSRCPTPCLSSRCVSA